MTEAQVRQSSHRALIGKRLMANIGRAIEKGETQGFMIILVDADSKEILGASKRESSGEVVTPVIRKKRCDGGKIFQEVDGCPILWFLGPQDLPGSFLDWR